MSLVAKARAVLGLAKPPVPPAPFVECHNCNRLVPAGEDARRDVVAAPCASCGRWSPLLEGTSTVFACRGCEGGSGTTYFALNAKGAPFSVYGLRKVPHLEPLPSDRDRDAWPPAQLAELEAKHKRYSPAAIEEALREEREVLSRQEEEARLRIPRYCINATCTRYCRPTTGGVMECSGCKSKIVQLSTVYRVCENPRCEISERDPAKSNIPRNGGNCRECGHSLGYKPGTVREEGIYE